MTIRKILVATDFSPFSEAAISYAQELALAAGAKITLLHVYSVPVLAIGIDGAALIPSAESAAASLAQANEGLEVARRRWESARVPLELRAIEGSAPQTIARIAAEEDFDLIIMGTHGRTGIRRAVLGSVAEHVVRLASVPVLTVRGKQPRVERAAS